MKLLVLLTFAQMRHSRARVIFSWLAIAAATCLVIWMVAGYHSMIAGFHDDAEDYMGRYDLIVTAEMTGGPGMGGPGMGGPGMGGGRAPKRDTVVERSKTPDANGRYRRIRKPLSESGLRSRGGMGPGPRAVSLDPTLQRELSQDPAVTTCEPLMLVRITATPPTKIVAGRDPRSDRIGIPQMSPTLIGIDAKDSPWKLQSGRWLDSTNREAVECVLGTAAAERMKLSVGDSIVITSDSTEISVTIVGLVKQARATPVIGPSRGLPTSSLFVSIPLAEKISGKKKEANVICIKLKEDMNEQEFRDRWSDRLSQMSPPSTFADTDSVVQSMSNDRTVSGQRTQANLTLLITIFTAAFIIFTTLSMGIQEKIRQLAMLRAIALTRGQIAKIVTLESVFLAIPGWFVGVVTCMIVAKITQLFEADGGAILVMPDLASILLGGICSIGGSLVAAIIPAWRASRIEPIQAIQGTSQNHLISWRRIVTMFVIGIVLISVHFAIVYWPEMPTIIRGVFYTAIGCPCMTIGFLLLTPMMIKIIEKVLTIPIAKIFGIAPQLLTFSLSGNMTRSVGTAAAMTVGLGLFISIHIWGFTMLVPFLPNDDVPTAFVAFLPDGIDNKEVTTVENLPGIRKNEVLPVAVEQMAISEKQLATPGFESTNRANQNVVLAGFDLSKGMLGKNAIFNLRFIEGNAQESIQKIETGEKNGKRYCLIPDTMKTQLNLHIGDSIELVPPKNVDQIVSYEIVGVVYIPGSIWLTKTSGMRRQGGRTLGLVLTTYGNVWQDAQLDKVGFFWMNLDEKIDARKFEQSLQEIAQNHHSNDIPGMSDGMTVRPFAKLWYAPEIIESVGDRSSGIIWSMSRLPIVILIITTLAVMNTILASIRTRTWEIGVFRAIGFRRSSIVFQIVSESILIGITAIVLSLAFGITAGWCSVITARYMYVYAVTGLSPSLVIPWYSLGYGIGLAMLLCLAAAIVPAIRTGRREITELLRSGRAIVE